MPENKDKKLSFAQPQSEEELKTIKGKNHILTIGIDNYEHVSKLYNPVKDSKAVIKLLQDKYRFSKSRTYTCLDNEATWEGIDSMLEKCQRLVKSPDNLIIYFSGHGHYDEISGEAFWIPIDARFKKIKDYYPYDRILKLLKGIKSHHTILIVDSCYSGATLVRNTKSGMERLEKDPSRYLLASGRNEVVSDGSRSGNSPFAEELLGVLYRHNDKPISFSEVAIAVTKNVVSNSRQTPVWDALRDVGHKNGEFVFHPKNKQITEWHEIKGKKDYKAIEEYLAKYPNSKFSEDALWEWACIQNKLSSYDQFLERFPNGKYSEEAQKKASTEEETLNWDYAKLKHTKDTYLDFINKFPKSIFTRNAQISIEEIVEEEFKQNSERKRKENEQSEWENTLRRDTLGAYRRFMKIYPDSVYSPEVEKRRKKILEQEEQMAWELSENSNTIEAYIDFLKRYPKSKFSPRAKKEIEKLRKIEEINRQKSSTYSSPAIQKTPKTKAEKKDWEKAIHIDSISSYSKYINKYPRGSFLEEAKLKREDLEKNRGTKALNPKKEEIPLSKKIKQENKVGQYLKKIYDLHLSSTWEFVKTNPILSGVGFVVVTFLLAGNINRIRVHYNRGIEYGTLDIKRGFLEDAIKNFEKAQDAYDTEEVRKYLHQAKVKLDSVKKEKHLAKYSRITRTRKKPSKITVKPKLMLIEGGNFEMGVIKESEDQKTQRTVTVSDFYIGIHEITNEEYASFLNELQPDREQLLKWLKTDIYGFESDYGNIYPNRGDWFEVKEGYEKFPITFVTWYGAKAYCDWLGQGYKLPTEAEWEYAAGGGKEFRTMYSGTNNIDSIEVYTNCYYGNVEQSGSRKPNSLGIFDMSGNVDEWCSERHNDDYFTAQKDLDSEEPKASKEKAYRGGSAGSGKTFCDITKRLEAALSYQHSELGFRVSKSAD